MQLDLGGIAKGYAGDEVLRVLAGFGITRALADAGGDLVLGDAPPASCGWRVAVGTVDAAGRRVEEVRCLANIAVATSGDTYRYLEADGTRYSHIIDPATGMGLTSRREVTVLAPTGMQADALASAVSVMGEAGLALGTRLPGVAIRLIQWGDEGCEMVQTEAFEAPGTVRDSR
jgi:thiamine biosynthesis lipoprotein